MDNSNLIDPYSRQITYLRLSVTDRCDLRCTYCMSEHMQFLSKKNILTFEEMFKVCEGFIELGIKKIRITGGEPLVRKDIIDLFMMLQPFVGTKLNSNYVQAFLYKNLLAHYHLIKNRQKDSLQTLPQSHSQRPFEIRY